MGASSQAPRKTPETPTESKEQWREDIISVFQGHEGLMAPCMTTKALPFKTIPQGSPWLTLTITFY